MSEEHLPPRKVRVTKLQEAQLLDIEAVEARCVESFYKAGLSTEQVAPRSQFDIVGLTKTHEVLVVEADDQAAGYLAWADQAPGVGYIEALMVTPDSQRFGLATHLLRVMGEHASQLGLGYAIAPCWSRAPWAIALLASRGFQLLEPNAPEPLQRWMAGRDPSALSPGQQLWWVATEGLGTIPGLRRP